MMPVPGQIARRWRVTTCALILSALVAPRTWAGPTQVVCESAVLTLAEAAALLRVDARDLRRLAETRGLPARQIGSEWRFSCEVLMRWLATGPEAIVQPQAARPLTTGELSAVTGAGLPNIQAPSGPQAASGPVDRQDRPVGEAPQDRPAEEIFLRGQRVLLGPGDVVIDFGQFYVRNDDQVLASFDEGVGLSTLRQQVFSTLVQGRVGMFRETELFAGVTYSRQDSRQFLGTTDLARSRRSAFDGTTVGVRRTLLRERTRRPNIIATFSGFIPNDDRQKIVGGGLVLVKSVDPAALFLNVNYFRSVGRREAESGRRSPLNRVDVSVGYALAVNDTLAINMAVTGLFAGSFTTADNRQFRQPGTFSARFGVTSWVARGLYVEPTLSFALTGPGRGFGLGVTLPYTF